MSSFDLESHILYGVSEIDPDCWDRLVPPSNPFLEHGFLATLEQTGCVGPGTEWSPRILAVRDPGSAGPDLVGAAPMYLKTDSRGEFVFDFAWANAAYRAGIQYYPKAIIAVPFTPVPGARLMVHPDVDHPDHIREALLQAGLDFVDERGLSSLHINFFRPESRALFRRFDLPIRLGFQYHWHNTPRHSDRDEYRDFDDFLGELRSKKRSNIKRERRRVRAVGADADIKTGVEVTASDLSQMFRYYKQTVEHFAYGNQYLNEAFFVELGDKWTEHLHFVQATVDGHEFGGALNAIDGRNLYGRYWGATEDIENAHFETCYYTSLEWCIKHSYRTFEGGSGGEHKFDRGFLPTRTYSAHYIRHPELAGPVEQFIEQEAREIESHISQKLEHTPFKQG